MHAPPVNTLPCNDGSTVEIHAQNPIRCSIVNNHALLIASHEEKHHHHQPETQISFYY